MAEMHYFIVTGASRGLGEALAEALLQPDHHLFCVSRTRSFKVLQSAPNTGASIDWFEQDLSDLDRLEDLMSRIFEKIDPAKAKAVILINNAGIIRPIAPASKNVGRDIALNVSVNLIAPMIITGSFIRLAENLPADKRVLNISSGAARKPYFGWSSYCSAKAGLDHYTRCVAVEQEGAAYPVKIVSAAPGVIDTEMQTEIRSSREEDFKALKRFLDLKQTGQLLSPEAAANKLLKLLLSDSFGREPIVDIRDLHFE
jgi:benzil reductase ((S)-benzoin forming)